MRRALSPLIPALLVLLLADAAAARSFTEVTGPGPGGRNSHATAATGDRYVWLHGGRRAGTPLADLWRLDLATRKWRRIAVAGARPSPRFGHNLVAVPGQGLVLFGGQAGDDFFSDVWRLDPSRRRWTKVRASGPAPRYGAAAALEPDSGRLVISHGFTNDGRFDDTWVLGSRFGDRSGTGARPTPRCLIGGAARAGRFFIFGGQSDPDPFLDDLWELRVKRRTWRRLTPENAPSERNFYAGAQTARYWYLHGGKTPGGGSDELWRFDLRERLFRRIALDAGPPVRYAHAAAIARGRLVIIGGIGPAGDLGDTWTLKL